MYGQEQSPLTQKPAAMGLGVTSQHRPSMTFVPTEPQSVAIQTERASTLGHRFAAAPSPAQTERASTLGHRFAAAPSPTSSATNTANAPLQRVKLGAEEDRITEGGGELITPGPLNRLGFLNPRRYLPTAVGGYTSTQMQEPQNTNVRGPLTTLGSANPRRYLPEGIGGYTREQMQEPHNADQSGLLNTLGIANPRRYIPTAVGGYSEQQMREPQNANVAGPMTMLGTANPRRYLPTALGGYSDEQMGHLPNRQTWGPLSYLGPANPRRYLPTAVGGYTPQQMQQRHNGGTGHLLDFYAWSNSGDTGTHHMTFARGWRDANDVEDFRQADPLRKIGPEVQPTRNSGKEQSAMRFNPLLVGEHTRQEHVDRMRVRPRLGTDKTPGPRHNQVHHLRVSLTDEERETLDRHVEGANAYHFYSEAEGRWEGANVARCMSPLEQLAAARGQAHKLPVADPGPMVAAFAAMNPDSQSQFARYPPPPRDLAESDARRYWDERPRPGRKPAPPEYHL